MKRTRKILLGLLTGLPVLIALVLVIRQWRQDSLNEALYQALMKSDVRETTRLLDQGANPNATYPISSEGAPLAKSSFWQDLWNRILNRNSEEHRIAALLVPVSDDVPFRPYNPGVGAIIALLLQHGADPNVQDSDGATPLEYAAWNDDRTSVRLLLEHGADPNLREFMGSTPLWCAAKNDSMPIIRLLLEHGADPNVGDADGYAPLYHAIRQDSPQIAKLLLDHGMNANGTDPKTRTSWMRLAVEWKRPDILRLLLEHGAKVDQSEDGETALEYALDTAKDFPGDPNRAAIIRLLEDAARKESQGK